ncbi:uncharacterized protein DNG_03796 [Cephalotrichum gorgonifer]|uniref:Uncharacterized protein n=1 Tax=Cephalotrichum gorgonifer TaxID=2041049 RepID=A0AAE8SUB3_9PEZI|nr:uncharacterized protein DNG_03796 [Cephalotrichum gorgonifer]
MAFPSPSPHRKQSPAQSTTDGEATVNPVFCGLVVSICAATAATLPREYYCPITIQSAADFVERNGLLAGGFLQAPSSALDWCMATYNFGTAWSSISGMNLSDKRSYRGLSDSAMGVRYLAYYCMEELDYVEQQLMRRLFWLLFAGTYSADMLGRLAIGLATPGFETICPRPLALSDNQLDPPPRTSNASEGTTDEAPWHGDDTSYIAGLNSLSDLFGIWHEIRSETTPRREPRESIDRYLSMVQRVIDGLPPELRWRGGLSRPPGATKGHDVQIANLFITSLHIRSNILQRFGVAGSYYGAEHQRIVDDLLEILYHMPQAVFEANGHSLVPKIRDIGAAYLDQFNVESGGASTGTGTGTSTSTSNVSSHGGGRERLERLLSRLDDLDYWHGLSLEDAQPQRVIE